MQTLVHVGGGPNSVLACQDGSLLVTQNGGIDREWRADDQRPPSIQRVSADGAVDVVVTEIEGIQLSAPNDLAFGQDGKLYFTDPAGGFSRTTPPPPATSSRSTPTERDTLSRRPGRRSRTASRSRRTATSSGSSRTPAPFAATTRQPARSRTYACSRTSDAIPDGLKPAADGDLYIATVLTGGVSVVGADGSDKGLLKGFGDYVSNVQFRGSELWVTDIGGGSGDDAEYHGSISRTTLEGVTGLELFPGSIS